MLLLPPLQLISQNCFNILKLFAEKSGWAIPPDSVRSVGVDDPNADSVLSDPCSSVLEGTFLVHLDPVDTCLTDSPVFGSDPVYQADLASDFQLTGPTRSRSTGSIWFTGSNQFFGKFRFQTLDFRVGYLVQPILVHRLLQVFRLVTSNLGNFRTAWLVRHLTYRRRLAPLSVRSCPGYGCARPLGARLPKKRILGTRMRIPIWHP